MGASQDGPGLRNAVAVRLGGLHLLRRGHFLLRTVTAAGKLSQIFDGYIFGSSLLRQQASTLRYSTLPPTDHLPGGFHNAQAVRELLPQPTQHFCPRFFLRELFSFRLYTL